MAPLAAPAVVWALLQQSGTLPQAPGAPRDCAVQAMPEVSLASVATLACEQVAATAVPPPGRATTQGPHRGSLRMFVSVHWNVVPYRPVQVLQVAAVGPTQLIESEQVVASLQVLSPPQSWIFVASV